MIEWDLLHTLSVLPWHLPIPWLLRLHSGKHKSRYFFDVIAFPLVISSVAELLYLAIPYGSSDFNVFEKLLNSFAQVLN